MFCQQTGSVLTDFFFVLFALVKNPNSISNDKTVHFACSEEEDTHLACFQKLIWIWFNYSLAGECQSEKNIDTFPFDFPPSFCPNQTDYRGLGRLAWILFRKQHSSNLLQAQEEIARIHQVLLSWSHNKVNSENMAGTSQVLFSGIPGSFRCCWCFVTDDQGNSRAGIAGKCNRNPCSTFTTTINQSALATSRGQSDVDDNFNENPLGRNPQKKPSSLN